ncbi:MAG: DMT family transporter [Opitutaceae bacterium]
MPAPSPNSRTRRRQAVLMLVLSTFFWGLSFPLMKTIALVEAGRVPSASGTFLVAGMLAPRFLLAFAALGILLVWPRRGRPDNAGPLIRPAEARQGLIVGLFVAGGMMLQNDGLRFTAASTSAFLTQFYAITIPLWLAFRHRRAPSLAVWASCLLVLAGVAILGRFDWRHLRLGRGELETLLCALFFMGQILWLEHPSFAGNRAIPMTFVMFAVPTAIFTVLGAATAPRLATLVTLWSSPAWTGFTLLLAFCCTVAPYLLMNTWQPKITATEAGLIYCAEPIFGTVLSLFLPAWFSAASGIAYADERAGYALFIGGGLILAANLLIQLRPESSIEPGGPAAA